MTGPAGTFEDVRQPLHLDERRGVGRVNLLGRWRENVVHLLGNAQIDIAREIARVVLQITVRLELGRVDEDRDHDQVADFADPTNQTQVPLVQRAHRGHETDPTALGQRLARNLFHRVDATYDLHRSPPGRFLLVRLFVTGKGTLPDVAGKTPHRIDLLLADLGIMPHELR